MISLKRVIPADSRIWRFSSGVSQFSMGFGVLLYLIIHLFICSFRSSSVINGLVRPSCLIIDEIGHCEFDKDCTRMFFDLIDRRYQKEGSFNIVLTSNKNPMEWQEDFTESNALLCALDRIFDDATVFNIKGASYRGRRTERVKLLTGATKPQRPVKK